MLHGEQLKYESWDNRDNIGFWLNPDEWVEWQFKVSQPGKFEVSAEIAGPASAAFKMVLGQQSIEAQSPNTGDYGKFQKVNLGIVQIPATGPAVLAIKPTKNGWQPMNLKAIRLKPVR